MNHSLGPLPENGRVVIIGGGPGGAAIALALKSLAAELVRQVQITVLESKHFTGERRYNQCVGVLSPPLPALLEDRLCVPFPRHLIRREIQGYILHSAGEQITLEGDEEASYAFRRVQFDAYMLDTVMQRGITVLPARAIDLEFHADCVVVYTDSAPLEADVVVGAFGLDEGCASLFSRLTPYRPPRSLSSVVTKYHPGLVGMADFGGYIHAFLPLHPLIEFGAVTPKGNHLTINIAGDSVDAPLMRSFLSQPAVGAVLPNLEQAGAYDPNDLRYFKGRFPRSLARGYFGDRYVMVGDAAGLVRAFKGKGVTSAVLTSIRAAEIIMQHGISEQAFHYYYRRANQDIVQDMPYGRFMRLMTIFISRYGLLAPVLRAARQTPALKSALFDAVSALAPYQEIIRRSIRPKTIWAIIRAMNYKTR